MEDGGYRHLPVVDDSGRPVGVLSVKRIVHYLVEHFPSTIHNQPPDPNQFPPRRKALINEASGVEHCMTPEAKTDQERESATIRLRRLRRRHAIVGTQFTNVSAVFGNDVSTLPDFPAEIRAPVGTLAGVSGFQLHFSSRESSRRAIKSTPSSS